jgi:MATE family multidrug resistance protein
MALQVAALAIKAPLAALFVFGAGPLPAFGVVGCGISTALAMWTVVAIAWLVMRRDPFYAPFALFGRGLHPPARAALASQLKLGVPMGGSVLIEVTGFASMAFFISRFGETPVAGHQIAANLVSLLFMLPLAISSATGTLVAQRIGARAEREALRLGWNGHLFVGALAAVVGLTTFALREPVLGLYTADAAVIAVTLPLVAWVAVFHLADAMQAMSSAVLRAWHVATAPLVLYAVAIWGVGLGGGYALAFDLPGSVPAGMQGARGFWLASTSALVLVAIGLMALQLWITRLRRREHEAQSASTQR